MKPAELQEGQEVLIQGTSYIVEDLEVVKEGSKVFVLMRRKDGLGGKAMIAFKSDEDLNIML